MCFTCALVRSSVSGQQPGERLNGDESRLIIPSHPSFSPLSLSFSYSTWTSPLSPPALRLTSLLPFPLLVTTWMCHCFYHFRGSCPLKHIEVISRVPKQRQDTRFPSLCPPPHKPPPPPRSPMDGTADTFFSQACGPHDGADHASTP